MNRFALLLLPFLASCGPGQILGGSFGADTTSDWYETGQVRKNRDEIIRMVRELLLRQGYLTAEVDAEQKRIETCWDPHYSPRWREGYRTKLEAEILPLDSGGFNVRIRSSMELNDNELSCSIPERAKWVGAGVSEKHKPHIPDQAIKVHMLLKNRFFGLNP
jgi:hypothetical protein